MMRKHILAIPLVLTIGILALRSFLPSAPSTEQATAQIKKELPKSKEKAHPIEKCLDKRAIFREVFAEFDKYKMVAFTYDLKEQNPDWEMNKPEAHNHDGQKTFHDPNIGVAVITEDALDGCTTVMPSLVGYPYPSDWNEKQRIAVKKLYWTYIAKELDEKHDVKFQEWILERTKAPGPIALHLADDDIKAIKSLNYKLHPWHVVGISSVDRLNRRAPKPKP